MGSRFVTCCPILPQQCKDKDRSRDGDGDGGCPSSTSIRTNFWACSFAIGAKMDLACKQFLIEQMMSEDNRDSNNKHCERVHGITKVTDYKSKHNKIKIQLQNIDQTSFSHHCFPTSSKYQDHRHTSDNYPQMETETESRFSFKISTKLYHCSPSLHYAALPM